MFTMLASGCISSVEGLLSSSPSLKIKFTFTDVCCYLIINIFFEGVAFMCYSVLPFPDLTYQHRLNG